MDPTAFCPSPAELALDRLVVSSEGITVVATARRLTVPWPMCGKVARRVHSHYTRTLADLPCMECTSASLPTCAASSVITCDRRGCRRRTCLIHPSVLPWRFERSKRHLGGSVVMSRRRRDRGTFFGA